MSLLPSGLSDGATLSRPRFPRAVTRSLPILVGDSVAAAAGVYQSRIAWCQSCDSVSGPIPSAVRTARFTSPARPAALSIWPTAWSPQRPCEWQHDAPFEELGHAAGAFAELTFDGVGLLEIGVAGVEDQRLPAVQFVVENAR